MWPVRPRALQGTVLDAVSPGGRGMALRAPPEPSPRVGGPGSAGGAAHAVRPRPAPEARGAQQASDTSTSHAGTTLSPPPRIRRGALQPPGPAPRPALRRPTPLLVLSRTRPRPGVSRTPYVALRRRGVEDLVIDADLPVSRTRRASPRRLRRRCPGSPSSRASGRAWSSPTIVVPHPGPASTVGRRPDGGRSQGGA